MIFGVGMTRISVTFPTFAMPVGITSKESIKLTSFFVLVV
jgi:hypothetical protein